MRIYSEKDLRERQAFKALLREEFEASPLSQEGIADAVGVKQPTVARWLSYQDNELPDLFQFSRFPVELLQPICAQMLRRHEIIVTRRDGGAIFDFRRVAIHELGHVLGLGHPDSSCDQFVEAVMNSHITDTDELAIDDRNGLSFLYAEGNEPPVADAGPNLFGNGTTPFVLDAAGSSDPDGQIVSYEWRVRNDVVARTAQAPVALNFGTYVVALMVTDDDGAADQDTLIVEVGLTPPSGDPQNAAPVADAGLDLKIAGGEVAVLDATRSFDPDGTLERYVWNEGSTILGRDAITPIALSIGTHDITLTVFDDDGVSASDTVAVAVIFDETVDTGPIVDSPPAVASPPPVCGALGMMAAVFALVPFAGGALRRQRARG